MSGVVVSCHGWRFQLLDQNPDHIDEDDYVNLAKKKQNKHMYADMLKIFNKKH